uniref:Uncharacterized protein n=1 Tax=Monopterus albus TaxID=43700 RepID=A0A3Q3JR82_MONAL
MESVRAVVLLSICLSVLTSLCQGQRSTDSQLPSAPGEPVLGLTAGELAAALQGFLDEADTKAVHTETYLSVCLSQCDIGERCAMKHGPRIGRLCDCLRGTACNTFFLRCY